MTGADTYSEALERARNQTPVIQSPRSVRAAELAGHLKDLVDRKPSCAAVELLCR